MLAPRALPAGRLDAQLRVLIPARTLTENVVDEHYRFVRAQFVWCFEKPGTPVIAVDVDATFMLYVKGGALTIVFQQEREDFRDALRSHGVSLA